MNGPDTELAILRAVEAALNEIPDVFVEVMPTEPGQDSNKLPSLDLYPVDTDQEAETQQSTDYVLMLEVVGTISAERRDAVTDLYALLSLAMDKIIATRQSKFGIDQLVDFQSRGMAEADENYRGALQNLSRAIVFQIRYRTDESNL